MKVTTQAALCAALAPLVGAWVTWSGCGAEFEPYNELSGFRVMAIQADRPWVGEGEPVEATALVHTTTAGAEVTWRWSWCPLPVEGEGEVTCAIAEGDFQELVVEATGEAFVAPGYALGDAPTARLTYPVPSGSVTAVCEALQRRELPTLLENPDCDREMTVVILLEASAEGETITAFKRVVLTADAATPLNANPSLLEVVAVPASGEPVTLGEEGAAALRSGEGYRLRASVPEGAVERYTEDDGEEAAEDLTLTWFVTGGETDFARTGFIEGETTLEEAGENGWTTPAEPGEARLVVVVRDNRGGVGWLSRAVAVE